LIRPNHVEALVFVNQTLIMGQGAPTASTSTVKVTLDNAGDRWLISGFDPV
jgi:Mce-associated membrane protein